MTICGQTAVNWILRILMSHIGEIVSHGHNENAHSAGSFLNSFDSWCSRLEESLSPNVTCLETQTTKILPTKVIIA